MQQQRNTEHPQLYTAKRKVIHRAIGACHRAVRVLLVIFISILIIELAKTNMPTLVLPTLNPKP
jgi:hypothetical protein